MYDALKFVKIRPPPAGTVEMSGGRGMTDPQVSDLLADRVALITGAGGSLGARAVAVMHAAGAQVVAVGRNRQSLLSLTDGLPRVRVESCDVTDEAATDRLVAECLTAFGGIDILVNNAGITEPGPALAESTASFRRVLETNVVAPFTLSRQVGAAMVERGSGSIVNIGSIFGLKGVADAPTGYAVSKAAIHGLTLQLAAQWARTGVRVNAIAPGPFASGLNGHFEDAAEADFWGRRTAMGRVAQPEEFDGILRYLAGAESSYVTGQVISVDGGWAHV
jgi:NAD(P)-dependent dehydrogenase (short-subunit alcohol dehydrogenase family)